MRWTTALRTPYADPPGTAEHFHTEQLVRLPGTFACFRPAEDAPPVSPLPALARGQVTFASFHNLAKVNDPLLECWAQILYRVPGWRPTIVPRGVDEGGSRQRLSDFFVERGIGIERLEFKGQHSLAQYLALHHDVDVLLDSHPFSGRASLHALWMGVPVVTLAGRPPQLADGGKRPGEYGAAGTDRSYVGGLRAPRGRTEQRSAKVGGVAGEPAGADGSLAAARRSALCPPR